jgi:predicted phage tail protein
MLRKIRLYGPLAKFIGKRVLQADVATPAEAVRFLIANWPEAEKHMADQHYKVAVGKEELPVGEQPEQLHHPVGRSDIRIIPTVAGAGAVGRIIAGVALIAFSVFVLPGLLLGGVLSGAFSSVFAQAVINIGIGIGASLALGGVAQLLSPVPSAGKDDSDPRKSFSFSGIQNTSRQGTPVPIIFGETLTGSVVISAGIDIVQVKA